jgi:hypothetical protein
MVRLGNVDNTADANKEVLSATKLKTARNIQGKSFDGTADITLDVATTEAAGLMSAEDKTKLNNLSNKNLLHNWDFRNPVNQRGQSSYTASVGEIYTVDRWILRATGVLSVDISGVTITPSGSCDIVQKLENETILTGEIATLSVDVDGTIYSVTFEIGNAGSGVSVLSGCSLFSTSGYPVLLRFTSAIAIRRAKLELGSVSTLANDPPADFGEELRKCQRYAEKIDYQKLFSPAGYCSMTIPFKATKRIAPTYAFTDYPGNANKISLIKIDWSLEHNASPEEVVSKTDYLQVNHNLPSGYNGFEVFNIFVSADL